MNDGLIFLIVTLGLLITGLALGSWIRKETELNKINYSIEHKEAYRFKGNRYIIKLEDERCLEKVK